MSPPTPETTSIIVLESVSSWICSGTSKFPAASHVYAVETCASSVVELAQRPKKATSAPAKATKVASVAIQPAALREMRVPASVTASAPTSGESRQIQAPAITSSPSERARLVDVECEAAACHRHDEAEPDGDLGGRDRHHCEREDLPVQVPLLPRERDQREVRRVQHDLEGEQDDERASAEHHAERADPEQDRRDDQVPADVRAVHPP